MISDTKYADLLTVSFSDATSSQERLAFLVSLRDVSLNADALAKLIEVGGSNNTTDVKIEVASLLIDNANAATKESEDYFGLATQYALYDAEPKVRVAGIHLISDLISIRHEVQIVLAEFFQFEQDEEVLFVALNAALDLPALGGQMYVALRVVSSKISANLIVPFFILIERLPILEQALCITEMLTPFSSSEVKVRSLTLISNHAYLHPLLFARICELLDAEPSPEIWAGYFTVLFRFKDLSAEQQIRAFETLDTRRESDELVRHFVSFFDSNPGLISHLQKAFEKADVGPILCFLCVTARTGIPDFALQALFSQHVDVRYVGVTQALKLISSHPEKITSVLLQRLATESHKGIRQVIINGLNGNSFLSTDNNVKILAEHYLGETDFSNRLALAMILVTLTPAVDIENKLQACWTNILGVPLFDHDLKGTALKKLIERSAVVSSDLQKSFTELLDETFDLRTFEIIFNQGKLLFPDLKIVMPALLRAFYRFAEFYPKDPLREIVRTVKKRYQELTDVHAEIGRIAEITGDSDLLSLASVEDQKNILYRQIQTAIRDEEVGKIKDLVRGGYEKKTLRKSEILKLYHDGLHHPCLQQILIPTIEVLGKVKLHSKEIVEAAFVFLKRYPYKNDSAREVINYLREVMEIEPAYANQFLEQIANEKFYEIVCGFSDFSKQYVLGRQFRDSDHWRENYSENHSMNVLENSDLDSMPRLREQVKQLILTDSPAHWNLAQIYLYKLSRTLSKNTSEDIHTVMALIRKTKEKQEDSYLLDRAANVFYYQWSELVRKKSMDQYTVETAKVASEVLNYYILKWYSRDDFRESYWINMSIDGIDLDHLLNHWQGPQAALDAFLSMAEQIAGGKIPERPQDYPYGMSFPEVEWNEAIIHTARLFYTARLPKQNETIRRIRTSVALLLQNPKAKITSYVWAKPVTEEHLARLADIVK